MRTAAAYVLFLAHLIQVSGAASYSPLLARQGCVRKHYSEDRVALN